MTGETLAAFDFDNAALPPGQQFDAWARNLPGFRIDSDSRDADFPVRARGWRLGPLVLSISDVPPITAERTPEHLADGADHYTFFVLVSGEWQGQLGQRSARAVPGDVCVLDYTQGYRCRSEHTVTISLQVPRRLIDEVVPPFDMHGLVIDGAAGRLLSDYIEALVNRAPAITLGDAGALATGTRDLIAAVLSTVRERWETQSARTVTRRAKRYILANLGEDLSPDKVARAVGTSRASLFRALEPFGGVQAFVTGARLARGYELLSDRTEHRSVEEIAFATGFSSHTHFGRLFKREYGTTPRSFRLRREADATAEDAAAKVFTEWQRTLRNM